MPVSNHYTLVFLGASMFCQQCGNSNNQEAKFCGFCGTSFYSKVVYVGFWYRVLSYLIDVIFSSFLILILTLIGGFMLSVDRASDATLGALSLLLSVTVQWLWYTLGESSEWQGTMGKKLLGLKVTNEDGSRLSFGRANARYWSKILSGLTLGIGFLMVGLTKNKQGLHDKIAGTVVIRALD